MNSKKIHICIHFVVLTCAVILVVSACSRFQGNDWNRSKLSSETSSKFFQDVRPYQGDVESLYLMACYFQERKKHKLALAEFSRAVQIDPTHVKAHNGMGVSHDSLGDHARAIECYKAALHVNPKLDYVLNNLGYAYLLQGEFDLAIDNFQQAIALNKRNSRYHNNLGLAYGRNEMYDQAFAEFELAGDKAKAHHNMARIFYGNGRYHDAAVHFSKASTINHSSRDADRGLAAADSLAKIFSVPETDVDEKKEPEPNIIKPTDNNSYRVLHTAQCGSFKNHENAQEKKTGLMEKGDEGSIQEKGDNEHRYAVNGGVFETGVGAKESAEEIMEPEVYHMSALWLKNSDKVDLEDRQPIKAKTLKKDGNDKANPVVNRVVIEVSNGNGVNRMARKVGNYLNSKDFKFMYLSNADHFNHPETIIYYRSGHLHEARKAEQKLPGRQKMKEVSQLEWESAKVKVVIGKDLIPHMTLFQKDQIIQIASFDEAAKRHKVHKKQK